MADITGYAIVTIDGVNYTVTITDGKGHVDVENLGNGTYPISVTYLENDKYKSTENNSAVLTVSKLNTTITIHVESINYTEIAQIIIDVPGVDLGTITVKLNDTTKTLAVIDGVAKWNVTGLAAGNYVVNATFAGNNKYNATSNTRGFEVKQITPVLDVIVNTIVADTNATITVYINTTATGKYSLK